MWHMFKRRLGPPPAEHLACAGCQGCPDILELENGDFAVIGTDMTEYAKDLPTWAGCAPTERIVRIPRRTLVLARADIPAA
jgi:hypothetical protein